MFLNEITNFCENFSAKSLLCADFPPCAKSLLRANFLPCAKSLLCANFPPCAKSLLCADFPPCAKSLLRANFRPVRIFHFVRIFCLTPNFSFPKNFNPKICRYRFFIKHQFSSDTFSTKFGEKGFYRNEMEIKTFLPKF